MKKIGKDTNNKETKSEKEDERLHNKNFIQAFDNASNGIVYSVITQTNIRKQLIIGALVLLLSLFYNFETSEFLSLTFAIFFVIFAEMMNTAVETIVDLITEVYNPKAKIAKDVGAGAVLLSAINAIIVAYFLFIKETDIFDMQESIFSRMISSKTNMILATIIVVILIVLVVKAFIKRNEIKTNKKAKFNPSGQAMIAFALLTLIWLNSRNIIVFLLSLALSLIIVGNRLHDTRSFGEVLFGGFMGVLIVMMIFGIPLLNG